MTEDVTPSAAGPDAVRAPLVVVRGEANAEEVAALTAVVAAIAGQVSAAAPPRPVSQWASRARSVPGTGVASLGGWRASALPR